MKRCTVPVHHYGKLDTDKENKKGEHYYKLGLKKYKLSPNDPIAIRELAVQAGRLEKFQEAISYWDRLAELQPNNATIYINMAYIHARLKNYRKAKAAAEKTVKLNPQLKEGYHNLGLYELHLDRPQEAEELLLNVTKTHKNYHAAIYLLGASQFCQGYMDRGKNTLSALQKERVWRDLHYSFQSLIESLMDAGCTDLARNLAAGAEFLNCSNDKISEYQRQLQRKAA